MLRSKKALSNFQSLSVCDRLSATVPRWLGFFWGHNDGWPQSCFFVTQSDHLTWVFWPGRQSNWIPGNNFKCWELYFLELYYPFLPLCQRLLLLSWRKLLLRSSQRILREFPLPIFQPMKDMLIGRRLRVEHPCLIHLDLCHVEWLKVKIPVCRFDAFLLGKDLCDYWGWVMLNIPGLYSIRREQLLLFVLILHDASHVLI